MRSRIAAVGAGALIGITFAMAQPVGAQAPLQPGDRVITVTPNEGLTDGQTVTVAWTGYTPNSKVTVIQCADAAGLKPETCNTTAAQFDLDAGPEGEGSVDLVVHTGETGPEGECSAGGNNQCVIAANEDLRDGITAVAPISFGEAGQDALPETGVTNGPLVAVGASAVLLGAGFVVLARRRPTAGSVGSP
jgi:LPXTG-motif cell wall-anchored protein